MAELTERQRVIFNAVSEYPGLSAKELAELLDLTYATITGTTRRLLHLQAIHTVTVPVAGRGNQMTLKFYPGWDGNGSERLPEAGTKKKRKVTNTDLVDATYDMLRKELEELRLWKQRAILRFPELDVDPVILLAREALAKHFPDKKQQDDILSGRLDKNPPMQAMIEVMSR